MSVSGDARLLNNCYLLSMAEGTCFWKAKMARI